jgi:hypothetical protein
MLLPHEVAKESQYQAVVVFPTATLELPLSAQLSLLSSSDLWRLHANRECLESGEGPMTLSIPPRGSGGTQTTSSARRTSCKQVQLDSLAGQVFGLVPYLEPERPWIQSLVVKNWHEGVRKRQRS